MTGGVAVVADVDLVAISFEDRRLPLRERGAHRRDGVLDARLPQRDDVHIALDDDEVVDGLSHPEPLDGVLSEQLV